MEALGWVAPMFAFLHTEMLQKSTKSASFPCRSPLLKPLMRRLAEPLGDEIELRCHSMRVNSMGFARTRMALCYALYVYMVVYIHYIMYI